MYNLIGITRYKIFSLISQTNGGITLSTISRMLGLSPQEVRRNLLILEDLKLVARKWDGSYYITVAGKLFAYFLNSYTKLCTTLEEGGYKDVSLPCQPIVNDHESKKVDNHLLLDSEEQDTDSTYLNSTNPQSAPDCLEWPLCPLLVFGRVNVGFVRLYNAIVNLLHTADRRVKTCILHKDLLLVVSDLLRSSSTSLWITIIHPYESSDDSTVPALNRENINLIAVPWNKTLYHIKGSIILSEKYGIYIPLGPRFEHILFFIEGESLLYLQHLESLMTQLVNNYDIDKQKHPVKNASS
jgi:DNA-binding transcriptional ArsR family regulator